MDIFDENLENKSCVGQFVLLSLFVHCVQLISAHIII